MVTAQMRWWYCSSSRSSPSTVCFTLHTVVTETREGAADFNAVNGGNLEASGPIRVEYFFAFQLAGDLTAQSENSTRVLPFEGVPDGVFTERANAFRERASLGIPFR